MKKEMNPAMIAVIVIIVVVVVVVIGFVATRGEKVEEMPQGMDTPDDMANLGKGKKMGTTMPGGGARSELGMKGMKGGN
jgi:hypothetical protein